MPFSVRLPTWASPRSVSVPIPPPAQCSECLLDVVSVNIDGEFVALKVAHPFLAILVWFRLVKPEILDVYPIELMTKKYLYSNNSNSISNC
jgi:hypothetical protein